MTNARYRPWAGLFAGLLLSAAGAAWAEQAEEAQRWLERMNQAVKTLNYRGTFVYSQQDRLETMRLIHRTGASGVQERLYSLTGAPREILRDNEKVTCIMPDDRAVRIDWRQSSNPFADVVPGDIVPLREHYRFELQGQARVAERATQVIGIMPRDDYRYGYRLWVDVDNGLLLRADLLNESGEVVEQLLFTELETFDSIPDDWLRPGISGDNFVRYQRDPAHKPAATAKIAWQATPPPGFELRAQRSRQLPGRSGQVGHLLFSDGLATVSVYIERADPEQSHTGGSHVGAVNAYGRWQDGVQFTVVGEVPARTVQHIADSMRSVR